MSSEAQETSAEFSYGEASKDSASHSKDSAQSLEHVLGTTTEIPTFSNSLVRLASSDGPGIDNLDPKDHEVLFYLSLIEGRCRTQALTSINSGRDYVDQLPDNHPDVVELTRHLFTQISTEFHKAGFLPDKFAGQNLEDVRARYLTTFDNVLQDYATLHTPNLFHRDTTGSISGSDIFSLSGDTNPFALSGALARRSFNMANQLVQAQAQAPAPGDDSFSLVLDNESGRMGQYAKSRYRDEYNEIGLLGIGGFGKVYKVKNHVDQQEYAAKKIIIPTSVMAHINDNRVILKILAEVRALARMNHQNVVRYHAGWVEATAGQKSITASSNPSSQGSNQDFTNSFPAQMRRLRINDRRTASSIGAMDSFENDDFDPFERSGPSSVAEKPDSVLASKQSSRSDNSGGFFRRPSESSAEEIPREESAASETIPESRYTLFITMALLPMTLDEYIWGTIKSSDQTFQLRHCFHTKICVFLLQGILNGIQYIHNEGIVHRDLKPSNIFLSMRKGAPTDFEGLIDVTDCRECAEVSPETRTLVTPVIGDFGLAAEMSKAPEPTTSLATAKPFNLNLVSSRSTQPGTIFYYPPNQANDRTICAKLDVYSLGVIAFELITKFDTKSERINVLSNLRKGIFPDRFDEHELAVGIRGMLASNRNERWTCSQVNKWLKEIKARYV